ncbi:hypothetical protein ABC347_10905 [Sphingomonas sp. 1P06PA]|uniref:hypothetical protein n=1 Tax=Sphingomonas sp. 1P06PA TaxID=554121 RepID=UPI0039A5744A
MKFVKLLTHAIVGGTMRSPAEGVLHLNDDEAKRLIDENAGEDVSDDFTAKQARETPVEGVKTDDGRSPDAAPAEPHQSEVAPQATEPKAAKPAPAKEKAK